jgi:signal transduction histidine kinase
MAIEADILARVFAADTSYASYFLNVMGKQLKDHPNDLLYIQNIFEIYHKTGEYNTMFGWRKYSWVNTDFEEIVTSTNGISPSSRYLEFMRESVNLPENLNKNNIIFYAEAHKHLQKEESLKLISRVLKNQECVGYTVLSYDIATITRRLNISKKNSYTNFLILSDKNTVILQSKPVIYNIVDAEQSLSPHLESVLNQINFMKNDAKEVSYVDMTSGISYYIKKIHNLPFILIINTDDDEIKNNILDRVIRKFLEISVFTCVFLMVVISIYKRETYLRAKAELATIQANRATKAKTNFLAFTAHEIRSPLGFISTGSEIMVKKLFGSINDKYHEYAIGINNNAKIILDFITDILDENQIIEGKFKIIDEVSDLSEIIERAIRNNQPRADKRSIALKLEIYSEVPKLICDARRILQVLSNLIINAIKYSGAGTVVLISIEIKNQALHLKVVDQGVGMTKDEVNTALSSDGIIAKDKENSIESYGLGLSIVKMLLEAHEAELVIESIPQVGTSVTIIFPPKRICRS